MEFHLLLVDDSLDFRVFGMDDFQQILGESLRACNLLFVWATELPSLTLDGWCTKLRYERDMNVHRLVSFSPCFLVHKTRADTLDLHPRLCLLLNVLHKNALVPCRYRITCTSELITYRWSNDLRSNIEVSYRFEADRELLLRPFTL